MWRFTVFASKLGTFTHGRFNSSRQESCHFCFTDQESHSYRLWITFSYCSDQTTSTWAVLADGRGQPSGRRRKEPWYLSGGGQIGETVYTAFTSCWPSWWTVEETGGRHRGSIEQAPGNWRFAITLIDYFTKRPEVHLTVHVTTSTVI